MTNTSSHKKVIVFQDASGKEPFTKWLKSLRDPAARRRILLLFAYLSKLASGELPV